MLQHSVETKKRAILAFSSGILLTLCYAPYNLHWLCWLSLAPIIKATLESYSIKEAIYLGTIFGVTFTTTNLWWIHQYSFLGWLGSTWVAIFPTLWIVIVKLSTKNKNQWWLPIQLGIIWGIIELTKIPPYNWNLISASTNSLTILQLCHLSILLPGIVIIAVNTTLAQHWITRNKHAPKSLFLTAIILVLCILYGKYEIHQFKTTESKESINCTLIATNYQDHNDPHLRWEDFKDSIKSLEEDHADLTILGESIQIPILSHQTAWDTLKPILDKKGGATLITCPFYENNKKYNASLLFSRYNSNEVQIYTKNTLAPVGEYSPWFLPQPESHYSKKQRREVLTVETSSDKISIGNLICIEESNSFLSQNSKKKGARLLVCPSNNSVSGPIAAEQLENLGKLSAIATRLTLIRVANNGITSVINPLGEISFETKLPGVFKLNIPVPSQEK